LRRLRVALEPELVDQALDEARRRAANYEYFFDRLESAEWIKPLEERGLFSEPPEQLVDPEGYIRAPSWPPSAYLARVASQAPDDVMRAFLALDTNNERIMEDFVDAALSMPAAQAAQAADALADWLNKNDRLYFLLPRKLVDLVEFLCSADKVDPALRILIALFTPRALPHSEHQLAHADARFSAWEYDHLLKKATPPLLVADANNTLRALVQLLEIAVQAITPEGERSYVSEDYSRLWRVRIASDEDRGADVEDSLVSAVRDAGIKAREDRLVDDAALIESLGLNEERLFRRIACHVLARPPEVDVDLVQNMVLDREEFFSAEPAPEYRELLEAVFPRLSEPARERILGWIAEGPDLDAYRELRIRLDGEEPDEARLQQRAQSWRVQRLRLLRSALPPDWQEAYDNLVAEVGDQELPVSFEVRTFVGPTSPLSVDGLSELSDDDLVEFLFTWKPQDRWDAPSIEGLARNLSGVAERQPARIAGLAPRFRGLLPAYVQWTLMGLENALRADAEFEWRPVLDLVEWIFRQPREIPGGRGDDYEHLDPGWVWTRKEVASLLETGFVSKNELPLGERARIWSSLSAVAEDPSPTEAEEREFGGSNMDPLTYSLNTTRPRGLRAAIAYADWVQRLSRGNLETTEVDPSRSLNEVPEVRELLDRHLDPEHDPSPAARAVYGQFFVTLYVIDQSWAKERAAAIFPEVDTPLREAAWGAYVIYNRPFREVFEALRPQYGTAVALLGTDGHGFRWMNGPPADKLAEHLLALYWRGDLNLGEPDALVESFFASATLEARAHGLAFVGRSLREVASVPSDVISRLIALWEWRSHSAHAASAELAEFAWWFSSDHVPLAWRLAELTRLLEAGVSPDPSFLVFETLGRVAPLDPLGTVRVLRLALEREDLRFAFSARDAEITSVLQEALSSEDEAAKTVAEDTVHWLGALGYRDFRYLLKTSDNEA
jgi:hypothetical protein